MATSKNIWNDPRITAYTLGELSGDAKSKFEQEVASNTELAAAVDETRSLTKQLKSYYSHEPTPPLEASRRSEILASSSAKSLASSVGTPWWKNRWVELAVAASILFVIVGLMLPSMQSARKATSNQRDTLAMQSENEAVEQSAASADGMDVASESLRYQAPAAKPFSGLEVAKKNKAVVEKKLDEVTANSASASDSMRGGYDMPAESQPMAEPVLEQLFADAEELSVADKAAAKSSDDFRRSMSELRKAPAPAAAEPQSARLSRMGGMAESDAFGMSSGIEGYDMQMGAAEMGMGGMGGAMAGKEAMSDMRMGNAEMGINGYGMGAADVVDGEAVPSGTPIVGDFAVDLSAGNTTDRRQLELNRRRIERSQLLETNPAVAEPPGIKVVPRGVELGTRLKANPYGEAIDEGRGPGIPGDKFEPITDNAFQRVSEHPLSTFSVDVDTASYSKVRDFLVRANQLPRPDAVRIEELVNYFDYDYAPPAADSKHPFAARAEIVSCPWNESHRLARIAIKGKTIADNERPACNLVFLIDTSGSMDAPNKLPLVQQGLQMLLSRLGDKDRVAIVVYAGSAGLVLDSTPVSDGKKIRRSLTQLAAGGSTNGGAGISLAYQTARDHFIKDGVNRVILCTDGDFNVGSTGTDTLVRMVEKEAKGGVFLTVLGFGMGNHNDAMLEQVSGKGNGNYAFIDTANEAKKVLVEQTDATLVTIAKDVKLQIEFNPSHVTSYRLIGYENRVLAKEDFNDDKKDAGEIGAGHAVTALYELVPAGEEVDAIAPVVDDLKYQKKLKLTEAADSDETLTVKLRYKAPDGDTSTLIEFPVKDGDKSFAEADDDVRFAAAVAGFGMKLRRSEYAGTWTLADVEKIAEKAKGNDRFGLRAEFVELVRKAALLSGQER